MEKGKKSWRGGIKREKREEKQCSDQAEPHDTPRVVADR